ncbi:MAG: aspartate dehydrogenase [Pseudomonadota bacterium]
MHLGLIGYGSIGRALVDRMPDGVVSEYSVLVRRAVAPEPGVAFIAQLDELLNRRPDLIVECAGHDALRDCLLPALGAGIPVIAASLGAFSDDGFLTSAWDAARANSSELILPSGAIGGLDILRAVAGAGDVQVSYRGIKPPAAWQGSPAEGQVNLDTLDARTVFFSGTGREAVQRFPRNANVVAALALAGPGFDAVQVELIADPQATGNSHSYTVTSALCTYHMAIDNAPSTGNARTSETTVLSIVQEVLAFARRPGRG